MAKRTSGRSGRRRKRRPPSSAGAQSGPAAVTTAVAAQSAAPRASAGSRRARSRRRAAERGSGLMDLLPLGERPRPPWYPWPLSELLILVGIVGTVVGFSRGAAGRAVLFAGLGAVALGTIEFTLREHLGGYRSHTILLAFIPTVAFHSAVALMLVALKVPGSASVLAPLVLDLPLFAVLFKLLRARFLRARRERTLAARN